MLHAVVVPTRCVQLSVACRRAILAAVSVCAAKSAVARPLASLTACHSDFSRYQVRMRFLGLLLAYGEPAELYAFSDRRRQTERCVSDSCIHLTRHSDALRRRAARCRASADVHDLARPGLHLSLHAGHRLVDEQCVRLFKLVSSLSRAVPLWCVADKLPIGQSVIVSCTSSCGSSS
jgi:hypothetical protein